MEEQDWNAKHLSMVSLISQVNLLVVVEHVYGIFLHNMRMN